MLRLAERRESGSSHTDEPEQVHIEDSTPLIIVVRRDAALRADTNVVDEYVQAPQGRCRVLDRASHRGIVADISLEIRRTGGKSVASTRAVRHAVEHGDGRPKLGEQRRRS